MVLKLDKSANLTTSTDSMNDVLFSGRSDYPKFQLLIQVKPSEHFFEVNVFEENVRTMAMPHVSHTVIHT